MMITVKFYFSTPVVFIVYGIDAVYSWKSESNLLLKCSGTRTCFAW